MSSLTSLSQTLTSFFNQLISLSSSQGESVLSGLFFALELCLAYLGGILASLSPCSYPLIPITLSILGGGPSSSLKPNENRWRVLSYFFGMTWTYAFFGILAALTGKLFGSWVQSSLGYLLLGSFMGGMALWNLEILSFPIAFSWLLSRVSQWQQLKTSSPLSSWLSCGLLGVSSGLIAAPCTTPILSAILAYTVSTQSMVRGFLLMIAFSTGLGTLILVLGYFSKLLHRLPRSGLWMNRFKKASGLLLLGFSGYLIYQAGKMAG